VIIQKDKGICFYVDERCIEVGRVCQAASGFIAVSSAMGTVLSVENLFVRADILVQEGNKKNGLN
jgi:hypothetical protein